MGLNSTFVTALRKGSVEELKKLLPSVKLLEDKDIFGETYLIEAIDKRAKPENISWLIQQCPQLCTILTRAKVSPILLAVQKQSIEVVNCLLREASVVNQLNDLEYV